jgi:hypothetical protein
MTNTAPAGNTWARLRKNPTTTDKHLCLSGMQLMPIEAVDAGRDRPQTVGTYEEGV